MTPLRPVLLVAPQLSRSDFELGTARYVQPGSPLLAIGLARVTPRDQVSAFNAAAQADGLPDFTARDRQRAGIRRPELEPVAQRGVVASRRSCSPTERT